MAFIWTQQFPLTHYKIFDEIIPKDGYSRCNPSIININDGYRTIIRTVNYTIKNDHDYIQQKPNTQVHTENIMVVWDKNWNLIKSEPIIDNSNRLIYNVSITGLEDMRQCSVLDKNYILCSSAESNHYGIPETSWFEWDPKKSLLLKNRPLEPRFENTWRKEKNWLPFEYNDKLYVIYENYPLTIHEINTVNGKYKVVVKHDTPEIAKGFRGSSGPIHFNDGWIYLVHEVTYDPVWVYTHRFVYLNSSFQMVSFSDPFSLIHKGIEFVSGLCYSHDMTSVWITFGIRDGEAYRMSIPISNIQSILKSIY